MTTPTIESFIPTSGKAGTKVTITGSGFTGVTNVSFNGTTASSFRANTDTTIIARPAQGTTTGYITVKTTGGSARSSKEFMISDAPTLGDFTPISGAIGASVTLNGSNLSDTSEVEFGANAATTTPTSKSDTQIKATVPASAITGQITVVTPGGKATTTDSFSLEETQAPTVSSFLPAEGPPNTLVTLKGTALGGTTEVLFGGVSATYFILSATSVSAIVPSNAISGVISVGNSAGTGISNSSFTVTSGPEIDDLDQDSGKMGTPVTLTGSNFVNVSEVTFGSDYASADFDVISETKINTTVPSGAVTGKISVRADAGTATSPTTFTVESSAKPTIDDSFRPTQGNYGTPVTISGSNFTGVTGATLGGAKVTVLQVVSDTTMGITVPRKASSGAISVMNTQGTGTSSGEFTIISLPKIDGFDPTSGKVETLVTIKGANFTKDNLVVTFNATQSSSVHFVSSSEIKATVPTGSTSGRITVTTLGGSALSSDTFTVEGSGEPEISKFYPLSGGAYDSIEITGSNFTGTSAVEFNGADAASFTVRSDTEIVARPSSDTTSGPIAITNSQGTGRSNKDFTFIGKPTLSSFKPISGTKEKEVTLTGKNFTESASVYFNLLAARQVTFSSTTEIKATVPSGATTGKITVKTEGGLAASTDDFTVESSAAPTITGFKPESAAVAAPITIGGTNFTGVKEVYFYNNIPAPFTVSSDTLLKATTPSSASTGPITIQNTVGKATSGSDLEILQEPSISGFKPGSGSSGAQVTISGKNFDNVLYVTFGTTIAEFDTNSDIQVVATVPENAKSGHIYVVTRAGSAKSEDSFNVTSDVLVTEMADDLASTVDVECARDQSGKKDSLSKL